MEQAERLRAKANPEYGQVSTTGVGDEFDLAPEPRRFDLLVIDGALRTEDDEDVVTVERGRRARLVHHPQVDFVAPGFEGFADQSGVVLFVVSQHERSVMTASTLSTRPSSPHHGTDVRVDRTNEVVHVEL